MSQPTKRTVDYIEDRETVTLSARISKSKMAMVEQKMSEDGIRKKQDLVDAMISRYLDDG